MNQQPEVPNTLELLMDAIGLMDDSRLIRLLNSIEGAIDWDAVESRVGDLVDEGLFDSVKTLDDAIEAVKTLNDE